MCYTSTHTAHQIESKMANSVSDAKGGHVLSCCLPVRPSIKQSLVLDSHCADNAVCLIPMVTRSLPHKDVGWLWIWADWDVHRLLEPIISPSEPSASILVWVLIRSVNMNGTHVHNCGVHRHSQAQTTLAALFSPFESIFFKSTQTHCRCVFARCWFSEEFAFRTSTPAPLFRIICLNGGSPSRSRYPLPSIRQSAHKNKHHGKGNMLGNRRNSPT